ncbi:MAG: hypothetical protein V3S24_13345 [Candidatus Tectomicrobia bacterium]
MRLLAIHKMLFQGSIAIGSVIILALMPIVGDHAASQIVTFESPALPPPLWHTNLLVMQELVLAKVPTFSEKELETPYTLNIKPRIVRAGLSYERVKGDFGRATSNEGELALRQSRPLEYDGSGSSADFKLIWDADRFSFGALIPYHRLRLDAFDANRIGTILFGTYDWPLHDALMLGFSVNGNYVYNQIDSNIDNITFEDFHTLGGNVSIALKFDQKGEFYRAITTEQSRISTFSFTGSVALSYQFNDDNATREDDDNGRVVTEVESQHLVMLGANVGIRIGSNFALTLYGIWNYDATTYKGSLRGTDDNYVDAIFEGVWNLSRRWKITSGYKKVLGYKELDIDQLFMEVTLRL